MMSPALSKTLVSKDVGYTGAMQYKLTFHFHLIHVGEFYDKSTTASQIDRTVDSNSSAYSIKNAARTMPRGERECFTIEILRIWQPSKYWLRSMFWTNSFLRVSPLAPASSRLDI